MGDSLDIMVIGGSEVFSVTSGGVVGSDETISGVVVSVIFSDSEVEIGIARNMYFRKILGTMCYRIENVVNVLEVNSHLW